MILIVDSLAPETSFRVGQQLAYVFGFPLYTNLKRKISCNDNFDHFLEDVVFSNCLQYIDKTVVYVSHMSLFPRELINKKISSCGLNAVYRLYLKNIVAHEHVYLFVNIDINRHYGKDKIDFYQQVHLVAGRLLGNAQLNRVIVNEMMTIEEISAKIEGELYDGNP